MGINCFNRFLAEVSTNLQKIKGKKEARQMTQFFHLLFELCLRYSHFYLKNVKIHLHGVPLGPFWSAKYLNFGGESCEIRILSRSIQEAYILRKVKNQVLLFPLKRELNLTDLTVYIRGDFPFYFKEVNGNSEADTIVDGNWKVLQGNL